MTVSALTPLEEYPLDATLEEYLGSKLAIVGNMLERGWCQGTVETVDGEFCPWGAWKHITHDTPANLIWLDMVMICRVLKAAGEPIPAPDELHQLGAAWTLGLIDAFTRWNDRSDQTQAAVVAAVRKASRV